MLESTGAKVLLTVTIDISYDNPSVYVNIAKGVGGIASRYCVESMGVYSVCLCILICAAVICYHHLVAVYLTAESMVRK